MRDERRQPDGDGTASSAEARMPRFALPEVVGVAMTAEEIAEIVQQSVVEMAEGLDCSRLLALSHAAKEGLLRGVTTVGFTDEAIREFRIPVSQFAIAERAIRTRQILVQPNADTLPPRFAPYFTGEIVAVPLLLGERVLAALIGQLKAGVSARSEAWRRRAEEVAARAALVVELERVASAYQDELRLRQSTRAIASSILAGLPLSQIAEQITETVAQRFREERVALFLGDTQGIIRPIALRNVSPEYGESVARLARRSPIVARANASDLPYYARNMQQNQELSAEVRGLMQTEGINSLLMAVLRHNATVKGALVLYPQEGRHFTPAELAVFQSFADQAALAVAITDLLDQQRELATLEERNRLAREIHDTAAQSLAALVLQLQTAQDDLETHQRADAIEVLRAVCVQAKKALDETRRAVQGLAPAALAALSPAQAIAEEVRQFGEREGIEAHFLLSGEEQTLGPEQGAALLRIAQEALTNAGKHAQARRIRIGLQYGLDEVLLMIEDDGLGFDMESRAAPGPEGGYGLFGMTERARLLGGEARIESTPGWGTRIQARLPYRPSSLLSARPALPAEGGRGESGEMQATSAPAPSSAPRPDEASGPTIRVLIADDHTMTRQGVRAMLEASGDIRVVGEAVDGKQAAELAQKLRPDVVLMDLQMPRVDGLEGLRRIQAAQPELPVVILTTFETETSVREALSAGARGYLLKDAEPTNLSAGVRAAYRGETLLSPAVTERLSALASGQSSASGLNEREREVLQLLAQGARNKAIAEQLFITPKTVEYHLTNIFNKLEVSNRTEAARIAIERGLITPGSRD